METAFDAPTLLRFPRDDDAFGEVVDHLAGAARELGVARPEYLEQRLKAFYPQAIVRAQDPLGGLSSSRETWYVYRDGSALGPID